MPFSSLFVFDSLTAIAMAIFAGLSLATFIGAPRRDRERAQLSTLAFITVGTLLAYSSASLPLFTLGWLITVIPYMGGASIPFAPKLALGASTVVLAAGVLTSYSPTSTAQTAAFVLLILAALIRKGIFPFHSWVTIGFERSPLLPLGLLLNGHLGLFLLLRFAIPQFSAHAREALPFLSILALLTALYTAVLVLSQTKALRILALLSVSQASFLLAGLQSRNEVGVAGALIHWSVVAVATTGLYIIYRSLEVRYSRTSSLDGFLGLVNHAPRLAIFFALCGFALIGLPGTLGFAAEDLLFHGSLESHSLLGVTLPLATALNGISLYRLFSRLFLGRASNSVPPVPDALPRERFVLIAASAFLLFFGFVPSILVTAHTATAAQLAQLLGER